MSTSAAASVKAPERVLQDALLRMMVLLASTIDELRTRQPKSVLGTDLSVPPPSHYTALARQIRNDVAVLLNQTQKAATALTLALKPSAASAKAASVKGSDISPVAGLDEASLLAAKAQIETLSTEVIPKLLWLARKTSSEGLIWRRKATASLSKEAQAEVNARQLQRDALEAEVEAMGGMLMDAKLEDIEGNEEEGNAKNDDGTERVAGAGLGATFTRSINSHIFDVLDSIENLANAYIDERARVAMQRASAARRGGTVEPASTSPTPAPRTAAQARALALQATAKVCAACGEAIRELPLDNIDAVARKWREREATMDDGWVELRKEVGGEGDEEELGKAASTMVAATPTPRVIDSDDPLAGMHDALELGLEEKARAKRFVPLVKLGRMLHKAIGKVALTRSSADSKEVNTMLSSKPTPIDLDAIELLAEDLASCQDDLVSTLLYGDDHFGFNEHLDDDEDDDDDSSDLSPDISLTLDLYVDAAILLAQAVGAHIQGETEDWNGDPLPSSATKQPQSMALKNVLMLAEEISKLGKRLALPSGEEEAAQTLATTGADTES